MAYDYIKRGKAEENGYTNTKVFKMFGISSTGYYNYVARKEDRNGKLAAKRKDESYVIRCFKHIIKRLGLYQVKERSVAICLEDSIIKSVYPERQRS